MDYSKSKFNGEFSAENIQQEIIQSLREAN